MSNVAPLADGSRMSRGSERGTCTIASEAPCDRTRPGPASSTMKFRLLFWMRGNGRAGSRPSGVSTGSTSLREVRLRATRCCAGVQSAPRRMRMPCAASAGSSSSFSSAYCSSTSSAAARWIASSWSSTSMPSGPAAARAELLALLEAGDADLEELVEVGAGDRRGTGRARAAAASRRCACASTRRLNSRNESSRLM